MIVPEHWAEAKSRKRIHGREMTIRRFGWSDESESAARHHAEERVAEAIAQIESGANNNRRERKTPYDGSEGVPIREEIVHRDGNTIITRNSYGALCLNTPDVLFADLDFSSEPSTRTQVFSCLCLLVVGFMIVGMILSMGLVTKLWLALFAAVIFSGLLFIPLARLVLNLQWKFKGTPKDQAMTQVRLFSEQHPDWHLRVYSTPAGLRVLVMHTLFDPNAEETLHFFRQLGTDRNYVRMCRKQNCFRARLTPKPWRIGYDAHLKPRPGVWPINPDRMPARLKWIEGYEKASVGFAACRFLESLGSDTADPEAERVRSWHDEYCKSESDLVIA